MATPLIPNSVQAWTAGATWQNTYLGNQYSQDTVVFQNNSGTVLYVGDVVILGNTNTSTVPDPTALSVTATTTAASQYVVGVVGGEAYNPGSSTQSPATVGGTGLPFTDSPWVYSTGTWTSGTAVLTDPTASAANIGKAVYPQDSPASWPVTPGIQSVIIGATPGTSYTVTIAPTTTRATATNYFLGPATSSVGPQWPGIVGYGAGDAMPVVIQGWAYVNIGAAAVAAGAVVGTSATARVAATVATPTAGQVIAVTLEANTAGIGSPDGTANRLVRAWICKM